MCGRFAQDFTFGELAQIIDILGPPASNFEPRYNIGPYQSAWFVRADEAGNRLDRGQFELVPFWWKKPLKEKKFSTFNAKSETIATTKSFAPSWKSGKRGLLPVSGFYEWPRPKKREQNPLYIQAAQSDVLWLGGVWSIWTDDKGEDRLTFAIVTTPANAFMEAIPHPRCPVVVNPDQFEHWLHAPLADIEPFLQPPENEVFRGRWVDSYVNTIGHEGPDCLADAPQALL